MAKAGPRRTAAHPEVSPYSTSLVRTAYVDFGAAVCAVIRKVALQRIPGSGPMSTDHDKVMEIAEACTAAWNSGAPAAVAEFYAQDGRIVTKLDDEAAGAPRTDAKRGLRDARIEPRVRLNTACGRNTRSRPPRQNPSVRRNASRD